MLTVWLTADGPASSSITFETDAFCCCWEAITGRMSMKLIWLLIFWGRNSFISRSVPTGVLSSLFLLRSSVLGLALLMGVLPPELGLRLGRESWSVNFKSQILGCWSVVTCVGTVTVFVKVTVISYGQSFSNICMAYFPSFRGFLSNNTGNPTSNSFLKPDKAFLLFSFLVPSFSFALSHGIKATKWGRGYP